MLIKDRVEIILIIIPQTSTLSFPEVINRGNLEPPGNKTEILGRNSGAGLKAGTERGWPGIRPNNY